MVHFAALAWCPPRWVSQPNARRQRRVTGMRHTNRKKAYAVTRPLHALVRSGQCSGCPPSSESCYNKGVCDVPQMKCRLWTTTRTDIFAKRLSMRCTTVGRCGNLVREPIPGGGSCVPKPTARAVPGLSTRPRGTQRIMPKTSGVLLIAVRIKALAPHMCRGIEP